MTKKKYNHGLLVGRFQPLHNGHIALIEKMVAECEMATIVIGTSQEYGTQVNPFRYRERKDQFKNYFGLKDYFKRIKIIGLVDIHDYYRWVDNVLEAVEDAYDEDFVPVEAYYCGCESDSQWYVPDIKNVEVLDRINPSRPFISGSLVREMCKYQDPRWKQLVPECNWQTIESLSRRLDFDRKSR